MKFSCTYALVDDIIYQSIFISGKFLHNGKYKKHPYLTKSILYSKIYAFISFFLENKSRIFEESIMSAVYT